MPSAPRSAGTHTLADDLLRWYDRHRRSLPWRPAPGVTADPYAVWLSEIMLQQTTTQAVRPFYARFLETWPSVEALAAAPGEAVMRAWAGLGYYARARNLHACAIAVTRDHDGRFPDTEAGLRALPGIGAYTAAAIAAFAFGRHAVVVDGNVERLMARIEAIDVPLPRAKPLLHAAMARATPPARAGDFAQGAMDLAATICTPRNPACAICPVRTHCAAAAQGIQADLPRRAAKGPAVYRHGSAFYARDASGAVLVRTRPATGLLGGTVELPGTDWVRVETKTPPAAALASGHRAAGRVTHVFTHFTLLLDVIVAEPRHLPAGLSATGRMVAADSLATEAFSTLMRNALRLAADPSCGTDGVSDGRRRRPASDLRPSRPAPGQKKRAMASD